MRSFNQFIEGIIDPKRDPKKQPYERLDGLDPNDDDYDHNKSAEMDDIYGDEDDYLPNKLGKTAQYPLAHAQGKLRGFQLKSPKELFSIKDRMAGKELIDTLRSKLYANEPMTPKEVNILQKALNQDLAKLNAEIKMHSKRK